jgi:hypothetical protein
MMNRNTISCEPLVGSARARNDRGQRTSSKIPLFGVKKPNRTAINAPIHPEIKAQRIKPPGLLYSPCLSRFPLLVQFIFDGIDARLKNGIIGDWPAPKKPDSEKQTYQDLPARCNRNA